MAIDTPYTSMYFDNTPTTPVGSSSGISSSSSYSLAAGGISAVAGAISSMFAGRTAAIGYQMQAAARRAQAGQSASNAKFTSMRLKERYNEVATNQAVMFSAQGRSLSSGSIQNILRVDQEKLQWDLDYTELAGEAGNISSMSDAEGFEASARLARKGSLTKGLFTLANAAIDYGKVK